jgi:hypothetical protein
MGQRRSKRRGSIDTASIYQAKTVVGRIRQELQLLRRERATILERIRVITQTLTGLSETFRGDIANNEQLQEVLSSLPVLRSDPGLTATCRQVLMSSSQPLTTNQICSRIHEIYPTLLARHKHPKVSVFVVVKRQVQYGDVLMGENERGQRTLRWVGGGTGEIVA